MPFEINIGDKYACIALENAGTARGLADPVDLGDGCWALFSPPFPFDATWRGWLGSLQSQHFERSNLFLFSLTPSNSPHLLDAENKSLGDKVLALFYALFLHDMPFYEGGLALTGANVGGTIDVRRVSTLKDFFRPAGVRTNRIDEAWLRRAQAAAVGIVSVHSPMTEFERLRRGFHAWLRAWMEFYGDERLHQSVRAVEAVIKADVGRGRSLFAHRGQLFVGNNQQAVALLNELYDLRSAAEHMNPFEQVLSRYAPAINTVGSLRAFQALTLANVVYSRILMDRALQQEFISDANTEAFWQRPWGDQVTLWGQPVDLEALTSPRFNMTNP